MQQAQISADSVSAIDGLYKEGETVDASLKTRGQERRPALGRKQARFYTKPDGPSAKVNYSKPDTNISLNIDDIDDPDEYFKAFEEQLEAEKEMQKLRGEVVIDATQHDQGTKTSKHSRGLSRRRAVYKHCVSTSSLYFDDIDDIDDPDEYFKAFEEQQEAKEEVRKLRGEVVIDVIQQDEGTKSRKRHPGLSRRRAVYKHCVSQEAEDAMAETLAESQEKHQEKPQEPELEGSVAGRVNNELDHLLASLEDVDEGEVESYLREMLHLKPIEVNKIDFRAMPNRTMHVESEVPKKLSPSIWPPLVSPSTFLKKGFANLRKEMLYFPEEDAADSSDSSS